MSAIPRRKYNTRIRTIARLTAHQLTEFLQRVSIACYAKRCTSYRKSVRPSVCLSVCPSVTRWHCVKTLQLRSSGLHCRIAPWLYLYYVNLFSLLLYFCGRIWNCRPNHVCFSSTVSPRAALHRNAELSNCLHVATADFSFNGCLTSGRGIIDSCLDRSISPSNVVTLAEWCN